MEEIIYFLGKRVAYAAHGFEIVATAMHEDFGKPELGETWRLELS